MRINAKKKQFIINGKKKLGIVNNTLFSFILWSPVTPKKFWFIYFNGSTCFLHYEKNCHTFLILVNYAITLKK